MPPIRPNAGAESEIGSVGEDKWAAYVECPLITLRGGWVADKEETGDASIAAMKDHQ